MRDWLHGRRLMWQACAFNIIGFFCDALSSTHIPAGLYETNPFVRDMAGGFVPSHALAYNALWLGVLLVMGGIFYFGIRRRSEMVAQVAFAALLFFYGVGSYAAAIHNLWLRLGWYN